MISLTRLPEPSRLAENKEKWLARFLKQRAENPSFRPDPRQYGHQEIRDTLRAMSFHKCFYCERQLNETEDEVEHYIDVALDLNLAFEWQNLYLSCKDCNRKKISSIPVQECLNPCDPAVDPSDHLTFDDEQIISKANSQRGQKTIQKYRLDRENLSYLRSRQLQQFHKLLDVIRQKQISEARKTLTNQEKEALSRFRQPEHAFSLMFSVYLANLDL